MTSTPLQPPTGGTEEPRSSRRTRSRAQRVRRSRTSGPAAEGNARRTAAESTTSATPRTRPFPAAPEPDRSHLTPLTEPREGLTPVIDRVQLLLEWCERAASAPEEPVALDAERASSFRYSDKAYLIQMRTATAGTALLDPTAFTLPSTLARTLAGREWVLHAALQDLPNFAQLGLHPDRLFDTELAARLLGMPKVSLGAVVEDTLQLYLAKEHSAADWSKRPLPESWLMYAALDVEVLVEVRDILARRLQEAGKDEWARQEFHHLCQNGVPHPPEEPWRGLSGIGALRSDRQIAVAKALWHHRDDLARRSDIAPFRIVRDKQAVDAARASTLGKGAFLATLPAKLRDKNSWWQAARSALELGESHLPSRNPKVYPPTHKLWAKKFPEVWARLEPIRDAVATRAEELALPTENLLKPALLRQWVWENDVLPDSVEEISTQLEALGARPWQAALVAVVIRDAFPATPDVS